MSIFLPDRRMVYRQYIETQIVRRELKEILRDVSITKLQEAKLLHIAEQMSDLQNSIYHLHKKELTDKEIAHKLNIPLHKIQKHLNAIERELYRLFRYMK